MIKLLYVDTETTGLGSEDRIVQLAYSIKTDDVRIAKEVMCDPGLQMDPMAAVITGIQDLDLKNKDKLVDTKEYKELSKLIEDKDTYFVAYNASFDVDMLEREGLEINKDRVIDMYKVAKILFKEAVFTNRFGEEVHLENLKLQYLRVILRLDEKNGFKNLLKDYNMKQLVAHTALSDIVVLEAFTKYVMSRFDKTIEELIEISKQEIIEEYINFGMIFDKGTPYRDILVSSYEQNGVLKFGYDYLHWCVEETELSMDTKNSIKFFFYNAILRNEVPYKDEYKQYIDFGLDRETNTRKLNLLKEY